ncbi:hypothetical protein BKA82DRAFT_943008 [Pisolithus tinctorius]|uniref:Uncharacterized protein n=1 Tax=Pisolithus tinctorius Marx 270 TaxID=870435 RepID=A0A0C3PEG3_PISTI|nr:hypothetical protein BKA82DRAFT_943008 [Pisolithus tinctorius]KIO06616.1 hypothetical protein M404DRAFT_943008 [Pisolithus tinctorius Marx 270]
MSRGIIGLNLPIISTVNVINTQSDPSSPTYAVAFTPTEWAFAGGSELCRRPKLQLNLYGWGHVDQRYQHLSGEWGAPKEQNSKTDGIDERTDPNAYRIFRDGLTAFAIELAKLVVRNSEGTTKFAEVSVESDAQTNRMQHCSVTLRIALDPSTVSVSFVPSPPANSTPTHPTPLPVFIGGEPAGVDGAPASNVLEQEEFGIVVDPGGQGMGGKRERAIGPVILVV